MRNFKRVVLTLILSVFCVAFANATNVNAELKNLQRQIDRLSSKIDNIGGGKSVLSDISLSGRFFITYDYNDNDLDDGKHNIENNRTELKIIKTLDYGKYVATLKKGSGDNVVFKDVGFYYNLADNATLAIGYLALPYSMEDDMNEGTRTRIGTSTYWFETGLNNGVLGDASGVGAYISYLTNEAGIHIGVVGNSLGDSEETETEIFDTDGDGVADTPATLYTGKSQMAVSSRVYVAPYVADNSVVMLGLTGFYRKFGESWTAARGIPYASTFSKSSVELMVVQDSFALLAEYMNGVLKVNDKLAEIKGKKYNLTDYYVQASYVLTGEKYGYDSGYFDSYTVANPINEGGFGSFELFAGYYVDDFDDNKNDQDLGQIGNKTSTITGGLNWSPLDKFRLFFTYDRVNVKDGKVDAITGELKDNKYNEYKVSARMFF